MSVSRIIAAPWRWRSARAVVTVSAGATPDEMPTGRRPLPKPISRRRSVAPLAAKIDQPAANAARPLTFACPKEPWPYGCQWREPPTRRVTRGSRPAG